MKKIGIIIVLLLIAGGLYAQEYGRFGIGANIGFNIYNEKNASGINEDKDTAVLAQVNLSFMLGESMELRPLVAIGYSKDTLDGSMDDEDVYAGAGIGAYWHILKTDFFRMGPGAAVDAMFVFDTYPSTSDFVIILGNLRVPMMMEFLMSKNIVFRAEYSMFLLNLISSSSNGDSDTYYNIQFFPMDASRFYTENQLFFGTQILRMGIDFRF